MVSIKTRGRVGALSIELEGLTEVTRRLRLAKKAIAGGADMGVVKAGTWIVEKVGESIGGNLAEPKSVDTGLLLSSIRFEKTGKGQGVVKPQRKRYPGTGVTTEDTAMLMEYSPNISGGPRRHFRNTAKREQENVKEIIKDEIKKGSTFIRSEGTITAKGKEYKTFGQV